MKTSYAATIALAIATLAAGQAMAANTPVQGKTREQVRAELMESRRNTDSRDSIEPVTGLTFRELSATPVAGQGKTRAQVRAEVLEVRHNTDSRDTKESTTGLTFRELNPSRYAAKASS